MIIEKIRKGDRAALTGLYEATASKAYGMILTLVEDKAAARKMVKELFVEIWQHPAQALTSPLDACSQVVALARRKAVDRIAHQHLDRIRSTAAESQAGGTTEQSDASLLRATYIDGIGLEELAERHELTPQQVLSKLWTGIQQLKEERV